VKQVGLVSKKGGLRWFGHGEQMMMSSSSTVRQSRQTKLYRWNVQQRPTGTVWRNMWNV